MNRQELLPGGSHYYMACALRELGYGFEDAYQIIFGRAPRHRREPMILNPFWLCVWMIGIYVGISALAIAVPAFKVAFFVASIFFLGAGTVLAIWARVHNGRWWP